MKISRPVGWGVCVPPETIWQYGTWIGEQELALLQPDCWLNWHYDPLVEYPGYTPMVWSAPDETAAQGIRQRMTEHPGETWLLFNEPERKDQANLSPQQAIRATQDFLRLAWEVGQPFQWTGPSVAPFLPDFDGMDWLTQYTHGGLDGSGVEFPGIRLLGMRPNYWPLHSYRSITLDAFRQSWQAFKIWHDLWGANAPIVITEACAEYAKVDAQKEIMTETRRMLDRGEVAGVYWFAAHRAAGWPVALCTVGVRARQVELSELGRHWLSLK